VILLNKIGLDDRTDDLLEMMDKIELDMNLAISLEQVAIDMLGIWHTSRGTKFEP